MAWEPACGEYVTEQEERLNLVKWRLEWIAVLIGLPVVLAAPLFLRSSTVLFIGLIYITATAVVGLNFIVGYGGLIVIAQGAFMAVGAYTTNQVLGMEIGLGLVPALMVAGFVTGGVSLVFGMPSFRVKGFYIAITTLALQFISEWFFANQSLAWIYGGELQRMPGELALIGEWLVVTRGEPSFYYLMLFFLLILSVTSWNISRTGIGRDIQAVNDNDLSASVLGINVYRTKLTAFFVGGFMIGTAGGLYAYYLRIINMEFFTLQLTLDHYVMLIFGGLGRVWGAILGTGLVSGLLDVLRTLVLRAADFFGLDPSVTAFRMTIFGIIIIVVLAIEPNGLMSLFRKIKRYIRNWPYAY